MTTAAVTFTVTCACEVDLDALRETLGRRPTNGEILDWVAGNYDTDRLPTSHVLLSGWQLKRG